MVAKRSLRIGKQAGRGPKKESIFNDRLPTVNRVTRKFNKKEKQWMKRSVKRYVSLPINFPPSLPPSLPPSPIPLFPAVSNSFSIFSSTSSSLPPTRRSRTGKFDWKDIITRFNTFCGAQGFETRTKKSLIGYWQDHGSKDEEEEAESEVEEGGGEDGKRKEKDLSTLPTGVRCSARYSVGLLRHAPEKALPEGAL